MIDTMDFGLDPSTDADRIEEIRVCMRAEVADFSLTAEEATGFENFDDVTAKADGGNELALRIMDRFRDALASCR